MADLLFVGCGKMGSALLRASARFAEHIVVVKPSPLLADLEAFPQVTYYAKPELIEKSFYPDAVILAVKPQNMASVLPSYRAYKESVFLSIAAGQTLDRLVYLLASPEQPIVRSMPNLPVSIGKGVCVAVANGSVSSAQRELCHKILQAGGEVDWIDDESLLDSVTALSGSGPAYVFALVEAMAAAGEKLGLSRDLAEKCARQTIIGSAALLEQTPQTPQELREAVTSPGGTTAAALAFLQAEGGLNDLLFKAMKAASLRAKEIST